MDPSGRLFKTERYTPNCQACCLLIAPGKWVPPWNLHLSQWSCLAQNYILKGSLHPVTCWWMWTKTQIPCFNVRHLWNAILCHIIPWDQLSLSCNYIVDQPLALTNAASLIPLKVVYLRPLPNIPLALKIPS